MDQHIRFCDSDGARVALATVGSGPPLVLPAWWVSHVEADWQRAGFRRFVGDLARTRTVVRYDRIGTGLSERSLPAERRSLAAELRTLEAVVEALALDRVDLLGMSCGGCIGMAFADAHPERVASMALYGSYAHGDGLAPPQVRRSMVQIVRAHWGLGSRMLAELFLPEGDADQRREFADFQREAAEPDTAADLLELVYEFDVRSVLDRLDVPTLVVHRRGDRTVPFACGVEVAQRLPGARLVPLDGLDHVAWEGDQSPLVHALAAFFGAADASALAPVPRADDDPLSAREREILRLVSRGLSDRQIAEALVLSPHTVHRHVANIRLKLGQPTRTAAVTEAARLQLL